MITLTQLQDYLNNLLYYDKKINLPQVDPYMANGLLVKGQEDIKKIGLGVSASLSLFEKAVETNCQALIVHHSINYPPYLRYDQILQDRFSYLIKNKLALFGYHFLLDSHPKIGHNVEIIRALGGKVISPYRQQNDAVGWGYMGQLNPINIETIINKIKPHLSPKMTFYPFGKKEITKIAVSSGKGTPYPSDMQDLIDQGIDLFITGEISEWVRELFREAKISFLAGGHYHTEKFGLLALKEALKKELSVEVEFLDVENEV